MKRTINLSRQGFPPIAVVAGLMIFASGVPSARGQVFTVDTNQSSLTISGSVVGGTIASQGTGSLTASLGGSIQIALVGNTIQFTGQGLIAPNTNGSWQPLVDGTAGAAPADFGGQANLGIASGVAALRNIQLGTISPAININAGQFDSSSLTFFFPSNSTSTLAYNVTGLISKHGSLILSGYATNKVTTLASLGTVGGHQVLTIPVDATYFLTLVQPNDTVIHFQGQLVAVQSGQAPLQVQSVTVQKQALLLQWQAAPGAQFQIQSSANLKLWQTNATIVTPASGVNTWTGAVTGPLQFFRLAK
jgi:hypothetical protein